MRAFWKKNSLVCLKIRNDLFTIGQMVDHSAHMRFFDIFSKEDSWANIDLNSKTSLFCVPVGNVVVQKLATRSIPASEVQPSSTPFERYFIKPHINYRGTPLFLGGSLVDLGPEGEIDSTVAPRIIENLDIKSHLTEIRKHELTNMYGDLDIAKRLCNFRETGVDRNELKEQIFPEFRP
jgi:hypothetical protein